MTKALLTWEGEHQFCVGVDVHIVTLATPEGHASWEQSHGHTFPEPIVTFPWSIEFRNSSGLAAATESEYSACPNVL